MEANQPPTKFAVGCAVLFLVGLYTCNRMFCESIEKAQTAANAPTAAPTTKYKELTPAQRDSIADNVLVETETEIKDFKGADYAGETATIVLSAATRLGGHGQFVAECLSSDDPKRKNWGKKMKPVVSACMSKNFPQLRKHWVAAAKHSMWQNDIEVRVLGGNSSTLDFVGGAFAANRNIEDTQNALSNALHTLRFKRCNFRWYSGQDRYTYYSIESKQDGEL